MNIKFDQIVEKIEIHILYSFFENRDVREIMWNNIVEWDRPQTIIWPCALPAGYPRLQTQTHVV